MKYICDTRTHIKNRDLFDFHLKLVMHLTYLFEKYLSITPMP